MKIGGPIEAAGTRAVHYEHVVFPPMKIGGPIEAREEVSYQLPFQLFPPMKIGGPIEAVIRGATTRD